MEAKASFGTYACSPRNARHCQSGPRTAGRRAMAMLKLMRKRRVVHPQAVSSPPSPTPSRRFEIDVDPAPHPRLQTWTTGRSQSLDSAVQGRANAFSVAPATSPRGPGELGIWSKRIRVGFRLGIVKDLDVEVVRGEELR